MTEHTDGDIQQDFACDSDRMGTDSNISFGKFLIQDPSKAFKDSRIPTCVGQFRSKQRIESHGPEDVRDTGNRSV